MNCRGLWQLAVCHRHHYNLLTRQGPDLFLPESLGLKYGISKRSFIREADSKCISPRTIKQWKRFPILNKLLKGHRRGEMTVFNGPTGSGKTTFISEYSLDLCMQGVSTLWVNFENNERLSEMMLTQFAQQNLAKNTELFDVYKEQFQSLPLYFMSFRERKKSIKKVFDAMKHAVYVHDIAHLVLDNLQFKMDWYGPGKQENIVRACMNLAESMNCHLTLVIPPTMDEDNEHLASQLASNVLTLQGKSAPGKKYLKVSKNWFDRDWDVRRTLLTFDKESRSFAAKE